MPPAKQNQQPWYKRHPLLAGAGTLALGGGAAYLGDKLLNGGKLTSQLLDSTKPAGETPKVLPQPVAPEATKPEWLTSATNKWQDANSVRDYKGTLADSAYEGGAVNPTLAGAANSTINPTLAISGIGDVTHWMGKTPSPLLTKATSLAHGINSVASPILDAQTWSEQPDLTQANAEFYGLNPERAKGYMGQGGAVIGSLVNHLPFGSYIDAGLRTVPRGLNDMLRRSVTESESSNMQGEVGHDMFNKLIHAVKDGDQQTISLIKQNFPHLGDQFYEGSKMRDAVTQAYARQQ